MKIIWKLLNNQFLIKELEKNERIRLAINKHREKAGHYFCNGWLKLGTNEYEKCQSFESDINGVKEKNEAKYFLKGNG